MRRVGDRAILLEFADNAEVHAAARAARARYGGDVAEVVPGHRTLLLVWRDGSLKPGGTAVADFSRLALEGADAETSEDRTIPPAVISIPTRYDGADLEAVAAALGLSCEAVVSLHTGADYTVAFMGFAPGFPYLITTGDPARLLELPRLPTPRTVVPVGSVAVAAGYCGIYPRSSPGGWNLVGHTDLVLFDVEREQPALLQPGACVRFEAVR